MRLRINMQISLIFFVKLPMYFDFAWKLPFHSQLINFLNIFFKKLAYIYIYNKCILQRNLC